jgi:hypothetical protein
MKMGGRDGIVEGGSVPDEAGNVLGAIEPECQSGPDIAANPKLSPPAGESTQSRLLIFSMSSGDEP